jgi:hypothetical protein
VIPRVLSGFVATVTPVRHPWTVVAIALGCLVMVLFAAHEHDPGDLHARTTTHPSSSRAHATQ